MKESMDMETKIKDLGTRLTKEHVLGLDHLKIKTLRDLFYHFPVRYDDLTETSSTNSLVPGKSLTIYGIMEKVIVRRSFRGHVPLTEARISDNTGSVRCIWFNQAYIGKMYPDGTKVKISGMVQADKKGFLLSNPHIERILTETPDTEISLFAKKGNAVSFLTPIYRETRGVTSLYLYNLVKKVASLGILKKIEDPIPKEILKKLHLPLLKDALLYMHFPKSESLTIAARKRFAFEEIFYLQLKQYKEKIENSHSPAYPIEIEKEVTKSFIDSFSFKPTPSQLSAVEGISRDLSKKNPMGRLLEGDVGSGKTFVAAVISYGILHSKSNEGGQRFQIAYMAPTEILAKQHFENFIKYFKNTRIEVGLLTSSGCKKFPSKGNPNSSTNISKNQLLKWLENGQISIVMGTHSLIQKTVKFKKLALVIIDEQHRFGVRQRKALVRGKDKIPHLLSMTATPIPRTLALTIFGDLDLTVIDEMPEGRKKIMTELVPNSKRKKVYSHIREELKSGRQVYVICPRIDENDEESSEKKILKNVKEEAKILGEEIFPEFMVDILHSRMKKEDKEEVMRDFLEKKTDILVATSVVEVGIDIQNATIIVIEHAERFGLAQLHQLRGRVGRREHQSYCYLFTENKGEMTQKRLDALVRAKNGFELAELDMINRGIGTLMDGKQWGISDLAMEAIKNPKLVEIAREEAKELLDSDENLIKYPLLSEIIKKRDDIHME